jgi:hypothetical protein
MLAFTEPAGFIEERLKQPADWWFEGFEAGGRIGRLIATCFDPEALDINSLS